MKKQIIYNILLVIVFTLIVFITADFIVPTYYIPFDRAVTNTINHFVNSTNKAIEMITSLLKEATPIK